MINKIRTVIILCGGKGSRLGSISKKIPKTLIKIHGKEILWYIINFLKKNKFNHFILPLGYKSDQIRKFILKNKSFGVKIDQVYTGENTNVGLRIHKVLNKIQSENLLILNGDAILKFNLNKIFFQHEQKKIDATFLSVESKYQFGTVCLKKGKIIDFKRNIIFDSVNVRNKENYIAYNYAGIILLKKEKLLKHSKIFKKCDNFEKDFYPVLIKKYKTDLIKIKGFFHSVDNIKDLMFANQKSLKGVYKNILAIKKIIRQN
tara:strand:- start:1150 stop:1932 length:783 start_codon:yes stop_codon:yes gene_type:complete